MSAEVIAIGSELTCGAKLDTNSQWLSRELEGLGWSVTRHTSLSDDLQAMASEFRHAAARSRVVVVTGGLGPTLDDITRDALALAFDQPLILDPDALHQIQTLFAARGREMPVRNQRQAQRPESARLLANSCGTAPGLLMRVSVSTADPRHECLIAVLPGVPAEMKPMFEQQVRPKLVQSNAWITRCVIHSFGFGESDVERMLGDLTARGRNPEVGITASEAVISLWITARDATADGSRHMADAVRSEILQLLGPSVFAEGNRELHQVVCELLSRQGQRVACVEGSTTGGLLAQWLTDDDRYADCLESARVWSNRQYAGPTVTGPTVTGHPNRTGEAASIVPRDEFFLAWQQMARQYASEILATGHADYVLLSSPSVQQVSVDGVLIKRGEVAVAHSGHFEVVDVSMTGNLSIFRPRAARTAFNCLRLQLLKSVTAEQPAG